MDQKKFQRGPVARTIRSKVASVVFLLSVAIGGAEERLRPNILIAVADDWSFGHAGIFGADWVKTPVFDRLADDGLLFNKAYTPNAKCAPSRACILTGRNSWQLKAAANHVVFFPSEIKSIFEALEDVGYAAGFTGKGWGPGKALDEEGNPRELTGKAYKELVLDPLTSGISNLDYAGNFEAFLDDTEGEQPWVFWYGCLEPHRGYEYGSGVAKGGKSLDEVGEVPGVWPSTDRVRNDILDYALEVEHFDSQLGLMLEALREREQLSYTVVIVTSDHGMPFPRIKGQAYESSNHVPLLIRAQDGLRDRARTIDEYVSLIDIAPSLLAFAGIDAEESGMKPIEGMSLLSFLDDSYRGGGDRPDYVLLGKERHDVGRPNDLGYPIRGIIRDEVLYIRNYEIDRWPSGDPVTGYLNTDGGATKSEILEMRRTGGDSTFWELCFGKRPTEELYLIGPDPDCMRNLALDPGYDDLKRSLASLMDEKLLLQEDPRSIGQAAYFDTIRYVDERTRDFYNRYMAGEDVRASWVNPGDFEDKDWSYETGN